ncbi:MAG TPA: PTS system mannose/fructose/sorbose family transporter subunit IID [Firmicutes bacterium]|nr:PTS system mannose/fructose/sorbose family transporter subunit IID [Candidatus Fermentithermobacillaceae bacterium]
MATNTSNDVDLKPEKITRRDVTMAALRWWWVCEQALNVERLQNLAFTTTMIPILKKLYKKKEDLSEALKRHLNFFNTQGVWGTIIHGTVVAMEEQKANGGEMTGDAIVAFKTALMGPMAGIGDTMDWLTLMPLILSISIPIAARGSWVGAVLPWSLFLVITLAESYFFWHLGYRVGRESIANLLEGGQLKTLMTACSVLGTFMMGALACSFVNVSTPLVWTSGDFDFVLQEIVDGIIPGLLPLLAVFGVYLFLDKKNPKYTTVVLWLLVIGIGLGMLGIL